MKPRSLFPLAVVIVIGLEKIHFCLAHAKPGEYEFPFQIPFHESVAAIHRAFPMQVKYVKEIMHSVPIQREEANPETVIVNRSQDDNKKPEELTPQAEMTKSPIEEKEVRSHFEVVKEAMDGDQKEAEKKPSIKKDSPGQDDEDEDDGDLSGETDDDNLEEDEEEEVEEEEEEVEDATAQKTEQEWDEEEVPTFPYRLSLVIQGPGGQALRHIKTGVIKAAPDGSYKRDDLLSLMMSLRNDEGECIPIGVADSENAEKQVKVPYQMHISAPVMRFSSQTMDHKGTIYRHEGMRPLPISVTDYLQNRQENGSQKQDDPFKPVQEQKPAKTSEEKEVTNQPEQPESTHDTVNEISPTKPKFEKEWPLKEFAKRSKPVDTPMYPKKYDASVSLNSKLRSNDFDFKAQEGSGLKELKEDFEDDDEEKEAVKKVVIIRPRPRVFHASFDVDGVSKKDGPPIKTDAPLKDLSMPPPFSFRQFWTPLRQILISKIFGHPSMGNAQTY